MRPTLCPQSETFVGREQRAAGLRFVEPPREEPCGTVAAFEDLYGNRWDFVERRPLAPPAAAE